MDDDEAAGPGDEGLLSDEPRFAADAMLGRLARWLRVLGHQLRDLVLALALPAPRDLFTRCLLCNAALEVMDRGAAHPLLPEGVRELPGPVRRCPSCGRLYWDGSHVRRMRAALDRILPGWILA